MFWGTKIDKNVIILMLAAQQLLKFASSYEGMTVGRRKYHNIGRA